MDDYNCKRSGQIPAFGDWDHATELPITQYFESAREAGLIGFSSSSAKPKPYLTVDLKTKHPRNHVPVRKQVSRVKEKREGSGGGGPLVTEEKKAGRVGGVTEPPRKLHYQYHHRHPHHHVPNNINDCNKQHGNDVVPPKRLPVDEDLYKITPEILHSSKPVSALPISFFVMFQFYLLVEVTQADFKIMPSPIGQ
ncbi:hypothetical protein ES332_A13G125400v1 [Gossypium tomentosum]|uniref:RIN4 pathogenic type III effector avirulence factor Avr cleavage site domain-containing protein n=1 Tax=Gossypium tomentosum TaxID=34277 RepID=A0A5D2MJ74_GOSTO|nr:hypothetical protein ES332_A13G125400v1 [Gossypium tomentosum]